MEGEYDAATHPHARQLTEQAIEHRVSEMLNEAMTPVQQQQQQLMQMLAEMNSRLTAAEATGNSGGRPSPTPSSLGVPTPVTTVPTPVPSSVYEAAQPQGTRGPSIRKPLPDPPKFSGKRVDYPAWAQSMRDKLELDSRFFDTPREAWYYIYVRLESEPSKLVTNFYQHAGPACDYDPSRFMEYLDQNFLDRNLRANAAHQLRSLKQGERQPFTSFVQKFERLLTEAGGATWDDYVKVTWVEGALNSQLRSALVSVVLPATYREWLAAVQDVAWKLETLRKDERALAPRGRSKVDAPARDPEGDVTMGGVNRMRDKKNGSRRRDGSGGASKETRACYSCGETGHLRHQCRKSAKKATLRASRVRCESDSEPLSGSSDDDSDEGKE